MCFQQNITCLSLCVTTWFSLTSFAGSKQSYKHPHYCHFAKKEKQMTNKKVHGWCLHQKTYRSWCTGYRGHEPVIMPFKLQRKQLNSITIPFNFSSLILFVRRIKKIKLLITEIITSKYTAWWLPDSHKKVSFFNTYWCMIVKKNGA